MCSQAVNDVRIYYYFFLQANQMELKFGIRIYARLVRLDKIFRTKLMSEYLK